MKCFYCHEEGETSTLFSKGERVTLLGGGGPYWDADGNEHYHDPNWHTSFYECSRGHKYATVTYDGKTWLGYDKFQDKQDCIYLGENGLRREGNT